MLLCQLLNDFDLQNPATLEKKNQTDVIDYYATQISMVNIQEERICVYESIPTFFSKL